MLCYLDLKFKHNDCESDLVSNDKSNLAIADRKQLSAQMVDNGEILLVSCHNQWLLIYTYFLSK